MRCERMPSQRVSAECVSNLNYVQTNLLDENSPLIKYRTMELSYWKANENLLSSDVSTVTKKSLKKMSYVIEVLYHASLALKLNLLRKSID